MSFNKGQSAHLSLRTIFAERTTPVIAWVGAGLSAAAGLPSWKGLAEGLLQAGQAKAQALNDGPTKGLFLNAQEKVVDDQTNLTRRDHSNLTHPEGYLTAAASVDKSLSGPSA